MVRLRLDKDKCKGCGLCILYCPKKVLGYSSDLNKRGLRYAEIKNPQACIGCGFCFLICPDVCIEIDGKEEDTH